MSAKNEIAKIASAIGSVGFGGVGLAAVLGAIPLAPIAVGGVTLAAGFLSGASLVNWGARDEIGLLKDQKLELGAELEIAKNKLTIIEQELLGQLAEVKAERDKHLAELERTRTEVKAEVMRLQQAIKYWEDGKNPDILEVPPVKQLLDTLRNKLAENTQKLDQTLAELAHQTEVNKQLVVTIDELEAANESLDEQLAKTLLDLDKLKENFNYKLEVELNKAIAPKLSQAVERAIGGKLAEIANLKKAIGMLQQELDNKEQVMQLLEREKLPEIESAYNSELNERDQALLRLSGENELLKRQIAKYQEPKHFAGYTYPDQVGNKIIDHFHSHGVIFDAHSTDLVVDGYTVKFKIDRNPDQTKLSTEEINKLTNQVGLMGLSRKELKFELHPNDFLISVNIYPGSFESPRLGSDLVAKSDRTLSTVNGNFSDNLTVLKTAKTQTARAKSCPSPATADKHRERFVELNCYTKDQFPELVKRKIKERARIIAGSAGGKSPLNEIYSLTTAKMFAQTRKNGAIVFFPNPLPGGDKDWFITPSIVKSGEGGVEKVAECLEELLEEVLRRCASGAESDEWPYIHLMLDEGNMIARYFPRQGELIKQILQAGSHAYVGLGASGQGLEITGWSGGSGSPANVLRANDFLVGASHILIDEAATLWINKHFNGEQREDLLAQYYKLADLCEELNELEGLTNKPNTGDERIVSPNAYRFAFCTVPAGQPFFFQIPEYGSVSIEGLSFPEGAEITSRYHKGTQDKIVEVCDRDIDQAFGACPRCLGTNYTKRKPYADGKPRYECRNRACRKTFTLPEV